jgi:hypothetical protein
MLPFPQSFESEREAPLISDVPYCSASSLIKLAQLNVGEDNEMTHFAKASIIIAMLVKLNLYAFGIMPFPNRYVT